MIEVEQNAVGTIIGRGGETIRGMQERYRVRITIPRDGDMETRPSRMVQVRGIPTTHFQPQSPAYCFCRGR